MCELPWRVIVLQTKEVVPENNERDRFEDAEAARQLAALQNQLIAEGEVLARLIEQLEQLRVLDALEVERQVAEGLNGLPERIAPEEPNRVQRFMDPDREFINRDEDNRADFGHIGQQMAINQVQEGPNRNEDGGLNESDGEMEENEMTD